MSRRTVLRGVGAAIALPWLETFLPRLAHAGAPSTAWPLRLAFVYVPNGVNGPAWRPEAKGDAFAWTPTLEPLAPFRDRVLVLSGLAHAKANANGDGPGDHARAAGTFLTGAQAFKTSGAGVRVGTSVVQVAAAAVGREAQLASLELGCDPGAVSGECDSGYSCAYSNNLAWRSESSPLAKEVNPQQVFDRLFADAGATEAQREQRRAERKSVLDFALDDAKRLDAKLGASDRRKLDEYPRASALSSAGSRGRSKPPSSATRPRRAWEGGGRGAVAAAAAHGDPKDLGETQLMSDLLVLAFQGDVTRVSTFFVANEGSGRAPHDRREGGPPRLSHHGGDASTVAKIQRIDRYHVELFAYLLAGMRAVKEGDGTLLDHSMIVYGSGIGDGNRHNHDELPILLAGGGNGSLQGGRHLVYPRTTPLCNLFTSLLERMGVPTPAFGDATGRLSDLG
jgi:hypothetical protein